MKRTTSIALLVLVQALLLTVGAFAVITVSPPHFDEPSGFVCTSCHTSHLTLGSTGYNNTCLNCHRPGDPAAGGRPITPADAANPFRNHSTTGISRMYQTSHRWDGSDTNAAAGAQPPVQAQMTTSGLRARTDGKLACVRCHNQHSNANGNFLRTANDRDQMCLDCHRSRNTTDHTKGSHPVGVTFNPGKAGFKPIPVNSANPSADLNNYLKNGTVSCSTCHGVHFTDSRSSTPDGRGNFANLSSGDGNLLRVSPYGKTASDENICTSCHDGKKNHNLTQRNGKPSAQCNHCHSGHVEFDAAAVGAEATPNVYLVRRYLQYTTAGRLSKRIIFNSTTTKNFYSPSGGGVCQSCHNPPSDHLSGISIEPGHSNCTVCHTHTDPAGAFSVGAGGCTSCHGYPPSTNTSGGPKGSAAGYTRRDESTTPHAYHASTPYAFTCSECHSGNSHNTGTFSDVFIDKTGILAGAAAIYTPGSFTCSTVYCHSAGQGAGGSALAVGSYAAPVWTNTTLACGSCHRDMKTDPAATGSHVKHAQGAGGIACVVCHSGYTDTTVDAAVHVNGQINLAFSGAAAGGTYSQGGAHAPANGYGTCATMSCHDTGKGVAVVTPVWGTAAAPCTVCHAAVPTTDSHTRHLSGTLYKTAVCADCHNGTVRSVSANGADHLDGNIDVYKTTAGDLGYPANKAKGSAPGSCATTYCHSSGQSASGVSAAPVYGTAPVWGGTVLCGSCHATSGMATGSHTQHLAFNTNCGICHTGASLTAYNAATHVDGSINVAAGFSYANQGAPGNGYSSCAATVCHGSASSPVWGANSANDQCTKCHGTGTVTVTAANRHVVAPSDAAATDTGKVSQNAKIGAHQTHLQYFNGLTAQGTEDDRCIACHGALPTSGTHANGSSTPAFQGLATRNGAYATSYVSGTCSVYCHNPAGTGGTLAGANAGSGVSPVWTNAAYLADGPLKTDANCNVCHKSPGNPAFTAAVTHAATITQDCSGCHGHNGGPGGVSGQQHMDGIKYGVGNCDGCHGYPPLPPAEFSARAAGQYVNAAPEDYAGGGGHHSAHILTTVVATDGFTPCLPCHPTAYHNQGGGTVLRDNINVEDAAVNDSYRFDGRRSKRYNRTTLSCSNISCHFQPTLPW